MKSQIEGLSTVTLIHAPSCKVIKLYLFLVDILKEVCNLSLSHMYTV